MDQLEHVHEKLQRYFTNTDFEFSSPKDLKSVSVQWLRSKNILHEGFLLKKSPHKEKSLQKRYTMLFGHYVFYFKKTKSKMPKGWFSLRSYDKVCEDFGDNPANKKFIIKIKNSRSNDFRVYCFQAESYSDFQMWKAAFEATFDYMFNDRQIKNRCQKHILQMKNVRQDTPLDGTRRPDYSIMLDSTVSDPDLSRLARSLGEEWKSFAREKLRITPTELDVIKKQHSDREGEVYAVLLHWRRKERDNATKRRLVNLLKEFSHEIDYCKWEFLEENSPHDYTNQDSDSGEDSDNDSLFDEDFYDEVYGSVVSSSNDTSSRRMQLEDFRNDETGVQAPPVPLLSPLSNPRPRISSGSRDTTVDVPPSLPPRPSSGLSSPTQPHFNQNDNRVDVPPSLPLRPSPGLSSPTRSHFNQNDNRVDVPPSLPNRPLSGLSPISQVSSREPHHHRLPVLPPPPRPHVNQNHSRVNLQNPTAVTLPTPPRLPKKPHTNTIPTPRPPHLAPRLFPPEANRTMPQNFRPGEIPQGGPSRPHVSVPGVPPRSRPIIRGMGADSNFAAELNQKLATRR